MLLDLCILVSYIYIYICNILYVYLPTRVCLCSFLCAKSKSCPKSSKTFYPIGHACGYQTKLFVTILIQAPNADCIQTNIGSWFPKCPSVLTTQFAAGGWIPTPMHHPFFFQIRKEMWVLRGWGFARILENGCHFFTFQFFSQILGDFAKGNQQWLPLF